MTVKKIASNWKTAIIFWLLSTIIIFLIYFSIGFAFSAVMFFIDSVFLRFFGGLIIAFISIFLGVWVASDILNRTYSIENKKEIVERTLILQIFNYAAIFLYGLSMLTVVNFESFVNVLLLLINFIVCLSVYYFAANKFIKDAGQAEGKEQIGNGNHAIGTSATNRLSMGHIWFSFVIFTCLYLIVSLWICGATADGNWTDSIMAAELVIGYFSLSGLFFILVFILRKLFNSN